MNSTPYGKYQTGNTDTPETRRATCCAARSGWKVPRNTKPLPQLFRAQVAVS